MSLKEELAARKAEFMGKAPPEIREAMMRADQELHASGIVGRAINIGDQTPDFRLPDVHGKEVHLADLLKNGTVVVSFYRGGWCPYCNLELRHWQNELAQLHDNGIQLIAISPQRPDNSLSTIEKNELAYPVLSDSALHAAEKFGIAFTLPPELV